MVRSTVTPSRRRRRSVHTTTRAWASMPAGRLVEKHELRTANPARTPGANRCCWPPERASIGGLGGVFQAERVEQPGRVRVGGVGDQPQHLARTCCRISPPPCNITPIRVRTARYPRPGSMPRTSWCRRRAVNPSHISTVVVLPAPFGPRRASTLADCMSRSRPDTAVVDP